MEKLIITAAICGAEVTKASNPAVPYTVEEMVREAKSAYEAGAAILHIHVRNDDGTPTQDRERFRVVMDAIRKELPDVIMIPSTGGATGMSPEERLQPTELFPEMATLDCGTCNFGDEIFDNTMPTMRAFGKRMLANNIKPEYECFEIGHLDTILTMAKKGEVPGAPMQFNFVLGVNGCTPATPENLAFLVNKIPAGSTWTVTGVGRGAWPMVATGIIMGGHVRVGFEDNIYMERGVKVGGSRFYFLRGQVARMQIAMLTMAVDQAEEHGFTLAITPTLVRPEVMRGTGFLNSHADEIYRLREPDDQYLVGTSEVALAGMHENEILNLENGPLRYCGWSSCYRREAGAAGKDTSGIIRVHQFDKVEMFVYAKQEDSYKEHEHLLAMEQEMLGKVEVPYRIIDTAAGDLGSSAARKFDCEAWVPTQGRYRELTSTSNCTEYQARRLNIRERMEDGNTRAVSTLNGTLATTRWLVAILENHQQKDGSIEIPKAMRPYMGGKEVIEPTKWEA